MLQSSQTLPTITDVSSSYDSSDIERSNVVGNDESDEVGAAWLCI